MMLQRSCVKIQMPKIGKPMPQLPFGQLFSMHLLSPMMNLNIHHVDYTQAFPEVELINTLFIKVP
jgi:hypothetical protein